METVAVDIGSHPLAGVLSGTQTQTVQTETEIIVTAAFGIFAAGVQLAKDQIPVPALLSLIIIDRNTAAEVLDLDDMIRKERDVDTVAVAVAGFINGVGDNFKNGMGAALDTVGAEDDRRALAHTVGAFQLADTVIAVFLLFFCHAAVPPDLY